MVAERLEKPFGANTLHSYGIISIVSTGYELGNPYLYKFIWIEGFIANGLRV